MNDAIVFALHVGWIASIFGEIIVCQFLCRRGRIDDANTVLIIMSPIEGCIAFFIAVDLTIRGRWVGATIWGLCAFIVFWSWWHGDDFRRRRKRFSARVLARVKDVGGKLKVIPQR